MLAVTPYRIDDSRDKLTDIYLKKCIFFVRALTASLLTLRNMLIIGIENTIEHQNIWTINELIIIYFLNVTIFRMLVKPPSFRLLSLHDVVGRIFISESGMVSMMPIKSERI